MSQTIYGKKQMVVRVVERRVFNLCYVAHARFGARCAYVRPKVCLAGAVEYIVIVAVRSRCSRYFTVFHETIAPPNFIDVPSLVDRVQHVAAHTHNSL